MAKLPISNTYQVKAASPFDSRQLVSTKSALISIDTWKYGTLGDTTLLNAYNGMIVGVGKDSTADNNGLYILLDATSSTPDVTNISNWHKIAEVSDLSNLSDKETVDAISERVAKLEAGEAGLTEEQVKAIVAEELAKFDLSGYATKEELNSHLDEVSKHFDNLDESAEGFDTQIANLNQSITTINGTIADHNDDISTLQSDLEVVEGDITDLKESVNNLTTGIKVPALDVASGSNINVPGTPKVSSSYDESLNKYTFTFDNLKGERGEQGPEGPKGADGAPGQDGTDGKSATITVGTVTTGDAGSAVKVTNSGTNSAAVFNFEIPQGPKGIDGKDGKDGEDGAAATITVGTVNTGVAGSDASVTNVGNETDAILNFTIPQGAKGDPFTYDDFTEEQLKGLVGPEGRYITGIQFTETDFATPGAINLANIQFNDGTVLYNVPLSRNGYSGTYVTDIEINANGQLVLQQAEAKVSLDTEVQPITTNRVVPTITFTPDGSGLSEVTSGRTVGASITPDGYVDGQHNQPQYKFKFDNIIPQINIGDVTYLEGSKPTISKVAVSGSQNDFKFNFGIPVVTMDNDNQPVAGDITYDGGDATISTTVLDRKDGGLDGNLNKKVKVDIKNPIVARNASLELIDDQDPTASVTQDGNKFDINLGIPHTTATVATNQLTAGTPGTVNVTPTSGKNQLNFTFGIPVTKFEGSTGTVSYTEDKQAGVTVGFTNDSTDLNKKVKVDIKNPVIIDSVSLAISPDRSIQPSANVTADGNKVSIAFTLPNLWDDGELN